MKLLNIIKYNVLLFVTAIVGLFAVSCEGIFDPEKKSIKEVSQIAEGERFLVKMGLQADDLDMVDLRSGGVESLDGLTSLRLLVFDENQNFLYSEDAVLGQTSTAVPTTNDAYLPDAKRDGITEMKEFTVSLIKSSNKRYIHFIANHDWSGFTQDYLATGKSAGEMLTDPRLAVTLEDMNANSPVYVFNPMWSVIEVAELSPTSLSGKVVKLLRNYAKITVDYNLATQNTSEGSFEFTGFLIANAINKGAIVPYSTDGYLFNFDFPPNKPTVPAGTTVFDHSLIDESHFIAPSQAFNLFEKTNSGDEKAFLIIRGNRTSKNGTPLGTRYYKVDLVTPKVLDPSQPDIVVNEHFPFLRNRHYQVNILSVNADGCPTIENAIHTPAGNNIFTSVELKDFGHISDGVRSLVASPLNQIVVEQGTYSFSTSYTEGTTDLRSLIQYFPSWDSATDPYVGAFTATADGFNVVVNQVPTDQVKEYTVTVVGPRDGGVTPIVRQVKLILRPPYNFNAVLTDVGSQIRTLEFNVPRSIPVTLVPFEVLIDTMEMTPVNAGDNKLVLVFQGGKIYYQYMVSLEDYYSADSKARIQFRMNTANGRTTQPVILTSKFYNIQSLPAETP